MDVRISKEIIKPLLKKHGLLTIEVDERHIALLNDVFELGVNVGINEAKEAVVWRINGPMWAGFIDKCMTPDKFIDEDEKCQS
jgi:hypothetical protein